MRAIVRERTTDGDGSHKGGEFKKRTGLLVNMARKRRTDEDSVRFYRCFLVNLYCAPTEIAKFTSHCVVLGE